MIKKTVNLLLLLVFALAVKAQQATMPTMMLFPSDQWMNDHGFSKTINDQGEEKKKYNYKKAFSENADINSVIQNIQAVFTERQFDVKDLQNESRTMENERAEELANAADGYEAEKGAMDELLQQANADIRVDVSYSVARVGPRKNIHFDLSAVDAYCSDPIASVSGDIQMTMDPVPLALKKAVAGTCDDFCSQVIDYFTDLRDNGRKIKVLFRAAPSAGVNFIKDEIGDDGDTYDEFLTDWMKKHAVNRACKVGRKTMNLVEFTVRIPFFDENGDPINGESWSRGIRKAFKEETGLKVVKGQGNTLGRLNFLIE